MQNGFRIEYDIADELGMVFAELLLGKVRLEGFEPPPF